MKKNRLRRCWKIGLGGLFAARALLAETAGGHLCLLVSFEF
ncbi:MAG: hypothetical protein FD189_662 [Elusimicrobia bacterium]|nr:MAG: hypothetical protein FD154_660 [Elusimicrobiota bacterium]KAF0157394.1 MAG: hypothetical protein FD189_662 [Elusimicrobiota bacterium]